ncbi:MAG: hypothetical protein H7257_07140 [Taibaiella sp.]|nr:hypothetical protein [Taibaiella sp.]
MKKNILLLSTAFIGFGALPAQEKPATFTTRFETSAGRESATWHETIDFYKRLSTRYSTLKLEKAGTADGGYPLHVVYYSADGDFNIAHWKKEGRITLLINNAIHPGEPDGVDACMMLLRDAAQGKIKIPDNVALVVIPMYNIGGALNRNGYSRANQNGPAAYGFRGNGQNIDLNRDFVKCDAAETRTFEKLFTATDPEIFIDNHVSDGADYQHIISLLATQHDKLGGKTGSFMQEKLNPLLYKDMKKRGYDLVPYVNNFDNTPANGWTEFYEGPRFSSGYAAQFQTIGYVPETHMLKPFKQRVEATYALLECVITEAGKNAAEITAARTADRQALITQKEFVLEWKADSSRHDNITFRGYEALYKTSLVSGLPRMYYDHGKPFTKEVPFYNHFVPAKKMSAPAAYIISRAWGAVISRMRRNGVELVPLLHDSTIAVTAYHIDNIETNTRPYEKHYMHKNIQVSPQTVSIKCRKGDFIIPVNQPAKRYIIETLEPTAPDAFLVWNFFDGILSQKEYFGDYIFEDLAAELLQNDAGLKMQLEAKRKTDTAFAKSAEAQLDFVYRHSRYMEPGYMRYPVYRVE